jgi:hypothetical protein
VRRVAVFLFLFLIPIAVQAEGPELQRPHWSLEIKGGRFTPDINDWKNYYGKDSTSHFAGALAYKIFRQVEAGIEGAYIQDKGQGFAPVHAEIIGNVKYELAPLSIFALVRGVFKEEQWVVPYIGGGWTRMYYKEKIENQPTVRGSANGYHGRAGVQFLLDGIDPRAATSFFLEYGVHHTYFFIEAQSISAKTTDATGVSIDLGGTSWLGGFLFEF